jgi:hypothetical protein
VDVVELVLVVVGRGALVDVVGGRDVDVVAGCDVDVVAGRDVEVEVLLVVVVGAACERQLALWTEVAIRAVTVLPKPRSMLESPPVR